MLIGPVIQEIPAHFLIDDCVMTHIKSAAFQMKSSSHLAMNNDVSVSVNACIVD